MIQQLYIIPNYTCNLSCPHCILHKKKDVYDREKFLQTLSSIDAKYKTLFGGEPTLFRDRLVDILSVAKVDAISTNLLTADQDLCDIFNQYNLAIATSWNPARFTDQQYQMWIDNLKLLARNNISAKVLITLTEDLLEISNQAFDQLLDSWDQIPSIQGVLFEPLLDPNSLPDLHERADLWLCRLHDRWRWKFSNLIVENFNYAICDCSNVYTLNPCGNLVKGCPQYTGRKVNSQCLACQLATVCQPCMLQTHCCFPKNLYLKTRGEN